MNNADKRSKTARLLDKAGPLGSAEEAVDAELCRLTVIEYVWLLPATYPRAPLKSLRRSPAGIIVVDLPGRENVPIATWVREVGGRPA